MSDAVDAVVTHHRDGFRSGVARFNELLAEKLGVPLHGLFDEEVESTSRSLLSFKAAEMSELERSRFAERVERMDWRGELYLHEYRGLELERELLRRARRAHCGNLEILAAVEDLTEDARESWTPGLVLDRRAYGDAELSVFSFGMAHKLRTDMFRRLRELLVASGRSYAVYVSAANHETASMQDSQLVFRELHEVFPSLYFLGNLSDVAVHNELLRATYFAAFFRDGLRANNTSVAAAMELGAVVITNLDGYSPAGLVHMENVIDITQCDELPTDPAVLRRIGEQARETAAERTWDALLERMRA